jgi:hypothetical protein
MGRLGDQGYGTLFYIFPLTLASSLCVSYCTSVTFPWTSVTFSPVK